MVETLATSVYYVDDRIELLFNNSSATDDATEAVESYKVYYSHGDGEPKELMSVGGNIYTKNSDIVPKNPENPNRIVFFQKWNKYFFIFFHE